MMPDDLTPPSESEKKFSQSELDNIVRARLANEKEKQLQLQAQYDLMAQQLAESNNTPASIPPPTTQSTGAAPVNNLTPDDVNNIVTQKVMEARQLDQQEEQQAKMQKKAAEIKDMIVKARKDDPEFDKLAGGDNPLGIDEQTLYVLGSRMGDQSLPIIKKALQDENTNNGLRSHANEADLISWAYKNLPKPENNEQKSITAAPDIQGFGGGGDVTDRIANKISSIKV